MLIKRLKAGSVVIAGQTQLVQPFALKYPQLTRALVITGSGDFPVKDAHIREFIREVTRLLDPAGY